MSIIVFCLALLSRVTIFTSYGFTRKFITVHFETINKIDLKDQGYYLEGETQNNFYIGTISIMIYIGPICILRMKNIYVLIGITVSVNENAIQVLDVFKTFIH